MQREIILTEDGSHSVQVRGLGATYHSLHGAIQESRHIFIEAGLKEVMRSKSSLTILEMGFGTGLNAWLTLLEADECLVHYEAIEAYPIGEDLYPTLNYPQQLNRPDAQEIFLKMHRASWEERVAINEKFSLHKRKAALETVTFTRSFDLIYFDAFAPSAQPELWTTAIFRKLLEATVPGGVLMTYCSKGVVRRAMEAAGWQVTKLPGPKGKREIVRAIRP